MGAEAGRITPRQDVANTSRPADIPAITGLKPCPIAHKGPPSRQQARLVPSIEIPHPMPALSRTDTDEPTPSPFEEFRLRERGTQAADERLGAARRLLRATWPVSTDTFVTGDLPLLLTRAGQIDPPR
jgi:hypothetical protein